MDKNLHQNAKAPMIALILFNLFAFSAIAQAQSFGGGSGTQTDPYIISTTDHLNALASSVNGGNDHYYEYFSLTTDLDFGGADFTPIGKHVGSQSSTGYRMFKGFFDGQGHTISNLTINQPNNLAVGLFGAAAVYGRIENLTLANSTITGKQSVGGIAGELRGGTSSTDRGVRNCTVAADVTVSGQSTVGGIVGSTEGDINGCFNFAAVVATANSYVGGITGYAYQNNYIANCYVGGNCTLGGVGQGGSATGTDEGYDVKHICTISFGADVDGTVSNAPELYIAATPYYTVPQVIGLTLNYIGTAAEGCTARFEASEGTLEPTNTAYQLTLPIVTAVAITAQTDNTLLDIGYAAWVSVNIADQEYTSSSLTPVATVTDSRSGTIVTLVEGTDYSLVLPEGGCTYPGYYDIGIVGIGSYAGRTTAQFHIYHALFNNGSGTENDPFIIDATEELDKLATRVGQGDNLSGLYFRQTTDLDYTGKTYTPVGNSSNPFCGHYDGYFNDITNVAIGSGDYVGLFGHLGEGGSISNLILANSSINGNSTVGGIAGNAKGLIENCYVMDDVTVSGSSFVGGIMGSSTRATINYCINSAAVSASVSNAGGITGYVIWSTVTGCMNEGAVTATNAYSGGIVGESNSGCTIEDCINTGAVTAGNALAGGIAGKINDYNNLKHCLNLATVVGNSYVGGIVGISYSTSLVGNYYAGNCTTGGVNGNDVAGAGRGYIVSNNEEEIFAQQWPIDEETGEFVGITFDGIFYVGAGETTKLLIEKIEGAPEGIITASAGMLKPLDEEFYDEINDVFYLLTMPAEGGNVNLTIAEGVGLTVAGYDESTNAGWKLIASPVVCDVAAATVSNIFSATQYDLYRFDPSSQGSEWRNHKAASFEMQNGKGYLYAIKEEQTLVFRGTYNTAATQDVPLVYDSTDSRKCWNLVGNPFPCEAYLDRAYYVLSANGTDINPDAIQGNVPVPPCTAVFVKALTEGDSVVFTRVAP